MAETIPARYIKMRNDPKNRHKVPTKYLKPEQAKERARLLQKKKDDANPLYDPMQSLKGSALKNAANQMASADVDPEIKGLETEQSFLRRYAQGLTGQMGDLYSQIAGRITPAVQAEQGASAKLTQSIADRGTAAQGSIDASAGIAQANATADPSRGIGLDAGTSQRLATQFAEQKNVALQNTQQQQATADVMNRGFQGLIDTAVAALPAQQAMATSKALVPVSKDIADNSSEIAAAKGKKGGLAMKYLTQLRQSGFENEAATQTLNLKADVAQAKATTDAAKADKPYSSGAFAGMKPSDVAGLSPAEIAAKNRAHNRQIHPRAKGDDSKMYADGAFNGMTHAQVNALSQGARDKKVKEWNALVHPGTKGKDDKGKGSDWVPTVTAKKDLQGASGALKSVRSGVLKNKNGDETPLKGKSRSQVVALLTGSMPSALISAVLDSVPAYNKGARPHLSKATQQRLIAAGYKPSQVASALGIRTAGQYKKEETPAAYDKVTKKVTQLPNALK